jgi:hypothetical protein
MKIGGGELGSGLTLATSADGRVPVQLLMIKMRRMTANIARFLPIDFHEALWRIAVRYQGERAWLILRCGLDHPLAQAIGKLPVRPFRPPGDAV